MWGEGQIYIDLVFKDPEKAYDRIPREEVWRRVENSRARESTSGVIQAIYRKSETRVLRTAGECSNFIVDVGLHQVSALSPVLFIMVTEVLTEKLRKEVPEAMMCADDMVLCGGLYDGISEIMEKSAGREGNECK